MTLDDIQAFLAVARAGGYREAARSGGDSASRLSEAVRRLEQRLGVRLLHRTTRSVAPTEAGARLRDRLGAALGEAEAALQEASSFADQPAGTLRLNVPVSAARMVLPQILPAFLKAHPRIRVDVTTDENFVDVLAAGCDAGVRYEERLEQDMIAIPIGPRFQRFAAAASPDYLERRGRPERPQDLAGHDCLRARVGVGRSFDWEFERDGETLRLDPTGPLTVQAGGGSDLAVQAAIGGVGIVYLFEDWLKPHLRSGALEPILEPWWPRFTGPFLYYPGRRLAPAPLRAFIDFIKVCGEAPWREASTLHEVDGQPA